MTVTITTIRRRLILAALLGAALVGGCKSKDTDGGLSRGGGGGRWDPLSTGPGRIAPTNLPVPERGGTAGGRRPDPLLGSPTARPTERSGYTDDPERFKGVYIPGAGSVPASLAGRSRDGDELKIDRPDPYPHPIQPAGGTTMPPASIPSGGGAGVVRLSELEQLGIKRGDYTLEQDGNGYTLRVRKEMTSGATRQYTETAATQAEVIGKMISHIKSDGP